MQIKKRVQILLLTQLILIVQKLTKQHRHLNHLLKVIAQRRLSISMTICSLRKDQLKMKNKRLYYLLSRSRIHQLKNYFLLVNQMN
ncbi:hypothetical protein GcC1_c1606o48 [Golovinomyces cichoracearum]|uniref:Secreted protein n=1 Tax=Golovinomyces cichoracearum TaxID=62708 RepID=A0A420IXH8_9PEZI|nr:hypothetical protein GcC1_c1606o48 [Golovinomyces cichoracearum]